MKLTGKKTRREKQRRMKEKYSKQPLINMAEYWSGFKVEQNYMASLVSAFSAEVQLVQDH